MSCPSATLAVWSSAWLHGNTASDDVLDALLAWGDDHDVVAADSETANTFELPVVGDRPGRPARLLATLRALRASSLRLVLPVAGDVRGLGGTALVDTALRAGEAAIAPEIGYAVVPTPIAEGLLRWTVLPCAPGNITEHTGLADAEHALTDAIRDSTGALQELDVAGERPDVHAELSARLRSSPRPDWPAGTPQRALRVLQRADEIAAILALADADDPGGAVSASAATHRAAALRPVSDAVRAARCAAINEMVRVFAAHSERPA